MSFAFLIGRVADPPIISDGFEQTQIPVSDPALPAALILNLAAPAHRHWRHYFSDRELNELTVLLSLDFRFVLGQERAQCPALRLAVQMQPFHQQGRELTVVFCCEERSPLRFIFWLVAVLARPQTAEDYRRRLDQIDTYWAD